MAGVVSNDKNSANNVELNLVPFIDLLSMLILFLLITAVWMQIAAVPASVTSRGRSAATTSQNDKLMIHLTDKGYQLSWPKTVSGKKGSLLPFIPKLNGVFDTEKLTATVKAVLPDHTSLSGGVSGVDTVDYGDVVQAIDGLKASGLQSVALSAN